MAAGGGKFQTSDGVGRLTPSTLTQRPLMGRFKSHSVRRASTGSLFAAMRDGMMPAMRVSAMLMSTSVTAWSGLMNALIAVTPLSLHG
jgi:hypothetical protein